MKKIHSKMFAIGALTCVLSGFGLGLLEMQQEAEAALLPNLPEPVAVEDLEATPAPEPVPQPMRLYTEADVDMLARLIYTEARGVASQTEQAAVVWCVLNRLDNPNRLESSIAAVVTAPYQFDYRPWVPVAEDFRALAEDVLERWQAEKEGVADVGRILPLEYQYFEGWGGRNWFSAEWKSKDYWDWGLPSPYED